MVLASFQRVFDEHAVLPALDWQHPAYLFRPHRHNGAFTWPDLVRDLVPELRLPGKRARR